MKGTALALGLAGLALLSPLPSLAGWPKPLDTWSFQYTTNWNWASDSGSLPRSFTNLSYSLLGDAVAFVMDNTNAEWLEYGVTNVSGGAEITVGNGSLVLWLAPYWASTNLGGTGPGVSFRLIELGTYTTNGSASWFSIFTDPGGNTLSFSSADGAGCLTNYISVPISWTTGYWHQVALTYSINATSNTALYLDAQWVTNGPPITCLPGADALTNGFYLGSDSSGISQVHGMLDAVATYGQPISADQITGLFNETYQQFFLNPFNPANLTQGPSSPSTNPAPFDVITGSGYLLTNGTFGCVAATNFWLTNVSAIFSTNGTASLTFGIAGGSNGVPYDVFATTELVPGGLTNSQWVWMGQGYHCTSYTIPGLPAGNGTNGFGACVFLILGGAQSWSHEGLTDAYELLVLHINPRGPQTDAHGVPYAWYALNGINQVGPTAATQDPDLDGLLNYQEYLFGTRPLVNEGFAVWVSSPSGTSNLP